MTGHNAREGFARILAGFRFFTSENKRGLIRLAVARETIVCLCVERRVVAGGVSRSVVVHDRIAVGHIQYAVAVARDAPEIAEESGLLMKILARFAGEEKVDGIGMARAVVARETVHIDAEKDTAHIDADFVNEVETVEQ